MQSHREKLDIEYRVTYQQYQQGLEQGRFLGLKCNHCDTVTFPPLGVCRKCSGTDLEPTEMGGEGTISLHLTIIRRKSFGKLSEVRKL